MQSRTWNKQTKNMWGASYNQWTNQPFPQLACFALRVNPSLILGRGRRGGRGDFFPTLHKIVAADYKTHEIRNEGFDPYSWPYIMYIHVMAGREDKRTNNMTMLSDPQNNEAAAEKGRVKIELLKGAILLYMYAKIHQLRNSNCQDCQKRHWLNHKDALGQCSIDHRNKLKHKYSQVLRKQTRCLHLLCYHRKDFLMTSLVILIVIFLLSSLCRCCLFTVTVVYLRRWKKTVTKTFGVLW